LFLSIYYCVELTFELMVGAGGNSLHHPQPVILKKLHSVV